MQYRGLSATDDIVVWFWKLVHSLKEEEKALLLKFATGSPRAPAGGFSTLQVYHSNNILAGKPFYINVCMHICGAKHSDHQSFL